jgi:toxin YoeB
MKMVFTKAAFADFEFFKMNDRKIYQKIKRLLCEIARNPFEGIGKPEPLKFQFSGFWSRRIDRTHRLVYKFENEKLTVISCRFHY